jgi:Kef-type K+ transport system membrane component KefB
VILRHRLGRASGRGRPRLGFGKELGGLLAGVSLASTPFREAIASRLASLRDFLLLFFFIALGAGLDLSTLGAASGRPSCCRSSC